jgi:peptidoglycan/xylan/chitin deacetylase (PgdA/CDA1 family)
MKNIVLTFDDGLQNHLDFVAPLLKSYGFGATFFVCEFPDADKFTTSPYLSWEGIKELSDMGFEIGNHTQTHPDCRNLAPDTLRQEIAYINNKCLEYGIPVPVSFAYPGGPVAANAIPLLQEMGFTTARACAEDMTGNIPGRSDPYRLEAIPVQEDGGADFFRTVASAPEESDTILVFHGVPDIPHPWVNSSQEYFRRCMDFLAEGNYNVINQQSIAGRYGK